MYKYLFETQLPFPQGMFPKVESPDPMGARPLTWPGTAQPGFYSCRMGLQSRDSAQGSQGLHVLATLVGFCRLDSSHLVDVGGGAT